MHSPETRPDNGQRRRRFILRATAGYLAFALAWVLLSDLLLSLVLSPQVIIQLSLAKGITFVLLTTVMLYFLLNHLPDDAALDKPPAGRGWIVAGALFVSCTLGLLTVAALNALAERLVGSKKEELSIIASLQATHIAGRIVEQRASALEVARKLEAGGINVAADGMPDAATGQLIERLRHHWRTTHGAAEILLLDANGHAPWQRDIATSALLPTLQQALRTEKPVLVTPEDSIIGLAGFIVPLTPRIDSPLAAIFIGQHVASFLLPTNPEHTPGLQLILASRRNDRVVFLASEPSTVDGSIAPKSYIAEAGSAIVQAVMHTQQMTEGHDHAGRLVMAASEPIAGTPWVVLATLDRDKTLAASNRVSIIAGAVTALAFLCLLLGAGYVTQHQRLRVARAETMLHRERQENQRRWQQALDIGDIGTFRHELADDTMHCDTRALLHLGISHSPIDLRDSMRNVHPDDVSELKSRIAALISAPPGEDFQFEVQIFRPDGSLRDARVMARAIRNAQGRVDHVEGVTWDISDLRRTEAELADSRRMLDAAQAAARIGSFIYEAATDHFICTPGIFTIFGVPDDYPKSIAGWRERVHPEDLAQTSMAFDALVNGLLSGFDQEYRIIRLDTGATRWVHGQARRSPQSSGHPPRITGSILDITESRMAKDALKASLAEQEHAYDELRRLNGRLQDIRENEGRRIAREIHDGLGQILTAVLMDTHRLKGDILKDAEAVQAHVAQMTLQLELSLETVRQLSHELHPPILDTLNLAEAIEWLVTDYRKRAGIRCRISVPESLENIPIRISANLFRICQELLTNISRHARASRIDADLAIVGNNEIQLRIEDNGEGFLPAVTSPHSLGLISIRERVEQLHGHLEILSQPELSGTRITVRIPLDTPDPS